MMLAGGLQSPVLWVVGCGWYRGHSAVIFVRRNDSSRLEGVLVIVNFNVKNKEGRACRQDTVKDTFGSSLLTSYYREMIFDL
eukprot:scaffold27272_cov71-Cyclotella_meneghiniana.AAC.2